MCGIHECWVTISLQVIERKMLPQHTGYLNRGLKLASQKMIGDELPGFVLKVFYM